MKFIRSISIVLFCVTFVPLVAFGQAMKTEMFWVHNLNERISENTLIGNDGNLYVNVNNNKIYSFSPDGKPVSALYNNSYKTKRKSEVIEVDEIRVSDEWSGIGQFDWEEVKKAFVRKNGSIYVVSNFDGKIYDLKLGIWVEWSYGDGTPGRTLYSTYHTNYSGGSTRSSKLDTDEVTLFIGSRNESIFAVNPDGTIKWEFKLNKKIYSNPVIGLNGMVYFGCDDKKLRALNDNGKKKWEFITGGRIRSAPFIGKDGTIYVGSSDSYLYAINQDGSKKWEFKTGDEIINCPVVGSDGTIYVGSSDSYLYAINEDGSKEWEFKTGGVISNSPVLGSDGTIYIASDDNNLYALNREGVNKWLFYLGSSLSSLNIDKNNNIFIGTHEGRLFGMKVNPEISGGVKIDPNVFGAEPAVAILSVLFDPLLNKSKTQPGGKISMNASSSGFETHLGPEKVNYKWRKNGVLLNHDNSSLMIESATNQDSGEYTVEIISESKSALSKGVMVIVSDPTVGDAIWKVSGNYSDILSMDNGVYNFIYDFASSDGGFEVSNIQPNALPGPFEYNADRGTWVSEGGAPDCIGPFDSILTTPEITTPSSGDVVLELSHRYSFEPDPSTAWDIGQVRVSVNGGQFVTVASGSFFVNGYFSKAVTGEGMMKGLFGFSGQTEGYADGAFITSKAIIGKMVAGDKFKVQFISGHDKCSTGAKPNWEIDSVSFVRRVPIYEGEVAGDQSVYVLDISDSMIYKLNGKTGRKENFKSIRSVVGFNVDESTFAHNSSLVFTSDDNYFVGATYDIKTLAPGEIDLYDHWATGKIIQRDKTLLERVNGQINISLGEGNTVFYSYKKGSWKKENFSEFWEEGESKFEAKKGSEVLWSINKEIFGKPVYDANNKHIYIITEDKYILRAIHSDNGEYLWALNISTEGSCPAIGSDSTIYIGSSDNNLYAINPEGSKKWAFNTGGDVSSSPVIGSDGTIYVGSNDNNLYAVDPKGSKKWAFNTGGDVSSSPVIGSDGTIYVGSNDNNLYAINPDGSKNWSHQVEGSILSVMIGDDGVLYCLSNNSLYALKTSSTGPADSPWPMFGQNAQRTGRAPSPVVDTIQINTFSKSTTPFSLSFESKPGATYTIEASHDLKKWGELSEVQGTGSSVKFIERRKAMFPQQYYRLKLVE